MKKKKIRKSTLEAIQASEPAGVIVGEFVKQELEAVLKDKNNHQSVKDVFVAGLRKAEEAGFTSPEDSDGKTTIQLPSTDIEFTASSTQASKKARKAASKNETERSSPS